MQYQVEEKGPLTRTIQVTVPAEEVDASITAVALKYRSQGNIPGFRKGKAPLGLVEKQFSRDIMPEATSNLIDGQVREIMAELKLEPASGVNHDAGKVERGREFAFSFSFDAMPEFELPKYEGFAVEEDEVLVDDAEIDAVIEQARKDYAVPVQIEGARKPQDGDVVSVAFTFYDESGEKEIPGYKAENAQIHLGQNQAMPEFEEIIKGVESGAEGEGTVEFAENFPNPEMAGKKTLVKVKVNSVSELQLPEVNDEFAARLGQFENVEAMRSVIRDTFTQSKKQQAVGVAKKTLLDSLLKMTDFPLPPGLVQRYVGMSIMDTIQAMQQSGKSLEELGKDNDNLKEEAQKEGENYVRTYIFLYRVAQAENIEVDENDLIDQLKRIAAGQRRPFEEVRDEYIKNNMLGALHERVMADKAMQAIYDKAAITYVKPKKAEPEADAEKDVKKTADKPEPEQEDKAKDATAKAEKSAEKKTKAGPKKEEK